MLTFCLCQSKIPLRNEVFNVQVRDSDLEPHLINGSIQPERGKRLLNLKQQTIYLLIFSFKNSNTTHSDTRVYLLRGNKKVVN
jgi:hypothetical protein